MKRLHVFAVMLFAAFAFGVLTVASASGAISTLLAEWWINGTGIAAGVEVLVESEGELLLEDIRLGIGFLCSGILDGWLGANGSDLITELLSLSGGSIPQTSLVEPGLLCVAEKGTCEDPLVWAVNLPWKTLLELVVDGAEEFFAVLITNGGAGEPGWYIECMNVIGPTSETCTGTGVFQAANEGNNVDASFSAAFAELVEVKLGTCSTGGVESATVEGLATIKEPRGAKVDVFSQ